MSEMIYEVRPGDTLTSIARKHGAASWRNIYYAPSNADFRRKRPNPDKIYPGDKLYIAGPSHGIVPAKTGTYSISSVFIDKDPHNGHFGTYTDRPGSWYVAEPSSINIGLGTLAPIVFSMKASKLSTFLFEIDDPSVVPRWFIVAARSSLTNFTVPNIFFHPAPDRNGLYDDKYNMKKPPWQKLFHYAESLGRQLGASGRDQVMIMPVFKNASVHRKLDAFASDWEGMVDEILRQLAKIMTGFDAVVMRQNLVLSSYSWGINYLQQFLKFGKDVPPSVTEVWDFDGHYQNAGLATSLRGLAGSARLIQYDQGSSNPAFHLPLERWSRYHSPLEGPPHNSNGVHRRIVNSLYFHAAKSSMVGVP